MDLTWWTQVLPAAFGGGLTVKLLDIAHSELRSRFSRKRNARKLVDDHLDPILKAADEIVGKLRSLAEEDFVSFRHISDLESDKFITDQRILVFLYLVATFWARIELLRRDSIAISLQEHPKGRLLKHFLDCIESRRVRLVDRGIQRAVGETLIDRVGGAVRTVLFIEFAEAVGSESVWRWYKPLYKILSRTTHTRERQLVLQYGAVLHALIDTLDPKHHVTGDRPGWPNKLSRRTSRALQFRVFGRYLGFVRSKTKYVA